MENYINKYNNIKYYHNEKNLGQFDNDLKLYDMAKGQFINYLMDDDLFELTKIEKMMNYFINDYNSEISLITSHRGTIDNKGNFKSIFLNTNDIFKKDIIISGIELGNFVLNTNFNYIGEPTTVLFRKNKLNESFGVYNNRKYGCNVDEASWFNLLSNGKAVFINEVLSYFRIHDGQQQNDFKMELIGGTDRIHSILTCRKSGFLLNLNEYLNSICACLNFCEKCIIEPLKGKKIETQEYREFEKYHKKLKEILEKINIEYTNKLPLVSILIPAYNQTKYLREALESAINQTYPNIEIIVGDDSTTDEVEEFIKPYLKRYSNVSYFKNEREKIDYGYINHINCLKKSKGEYINFLNHDDVFHPQKIEKMMRYFLEEPNVTLVTSVRQPIDENGDKLALNGAFKKLFDKDTLVSGREFSKYIITKLTNYIGEPTTVLFKRKYISEEQLNYYNGIRFRNIGDVANWLTLLQYGDAIYISEPLSYFRMHSDQNSNKIDVHIMGVIAWYKLIKNGYETGIIENIDQYKSIVNLWLKTFTPTLGNFVKYSNYIDNELKDELSNAYGNAIKEIIYKNAKKFYECPVCGNKVERFLPYQYKKHVSDFSYKFNAIGSDTENFSCPHCYCHDRERHLVKYFDKLNIWDKYIIGKNVLHIAPEKHVQQIISNLSTKDYICGDLYPINESIMKIDITDMQFEDNYFDFIICNHVLEHIPNDLKAMKELFRVLKKGGCAVLQTPYSPDIDKSFEDETINTDQQRKKFFGQSDHVRIYGKDLFERVKSAGFELKIVKNNDLFTEEESKKYGVNNKEDLILVVKE
jgi:glycosyltransferase involved in cell wall biosynthesis